MTIQVNATIQGEFNSNRIGAPLNKWSKGLQDHLCKNIYIGTCTDDKWIFLIILEMIWLNFLLLMHDPQIAWIRPDLYKSEC